MRRLLMLLAVLCAAPAFPQEFKLTALVGYTTAGSLEHDTGCCFVYQFGDAASRWRPFLAAGADMALVSSPDLEGETKLSFSVGGGLKWLVSNRLGARLQAKYTPTHLNDGGSDICDPFGFCQDWLEPVRADGGRARPVLSDWW